MSNSLLRSATEYRQDIDNALALIRGELTIDELEKLGVTSKLTESICKALFPDRDNRHGTWIQTFTGVELDPLRPTVESVVLEDIAHALSMKCRYNGHIEEFYSVAQHSVVMSYLAEEFATGQEKAALMHDSPEFALPDICRPIKHYFFGFNKLEQGIHDVVGEKFGIPKELTKEIKYLDDTIIVDEAKLYMKKNLENWGFQDLNFTYGERFKNMIWPSWKPSVAKSAFLTRFEELWGESWTQY